ncbi:MAG: four helix bundle protein [Sphingobacteriales bacterium]|nr:four helix bundle protein [Sphingobacteriales bacterium]
MALYYDLPVYRDTYKLILKIFEYTKDFPKDYKYTLGQDMKRDALHLVRSIYRANKSVQKKEHLDDFMDDFELIKLEIRLCTDMKVLPIKKQAELSLLMDSIGKQITGWSKSQPPPWFVAHETVSYLTTHNRDYLKPDNKELLFFRFVSHEPGQGKKKQQINEEDIESIILKN